MEVDSISSSATHHERIAGLEVLRIVAVCAIAWFHAGAPYSELMGWRLASLLLMSIALPLRRADETSPGRFVSRRARRLLIPWVFWWAIYGLVMTAKMLLGHPPRTHLSPWQLVFYGTSSHLWYLPYAFAASVISLMLWRMLNRARPDRAMILMWTMGLIALVVISLLFPLAGSLLPVPLPQYLISAPAIPLGIAIAIGWRRGLTPETRRWLAHAALVTFAALFCIAAASGWNRGLGGLQAGLVDGPLLVFTRYSLAGLLFCAALLWKRGLPPMLEQFSSLAFGVYLLHPLVSMFLVRFGLVTPATYGHGAVLIVTSTAAAFALSRSPLKRFI